MVSVGTIVWLSSELMFFAALFAAYFTIRSVQPELWAQNTELLNVPFSAVNTTILVLSSVTCQLGVFAAEKGQVGRTGKALTLHPVKEWGLREWFVLTYIMGAIFIGGQALRVRRAGPRERHHPGLQPTARCSTSPPDSTACTSPGGWSPSCSCSVAPSIARKFTHEQAVTAIVVSYYWHFVDIVWIALFATVYLIK